ncbi:MAG: Glycerol-3-phosphate dehydrogenase [NAD(P)+] [Alphaproteobacteria bacterium MarineAlpha9_Bin4]|nr:glycerol-3-phosphate dehydrogenase [Pelagibacterales bacterium]PPR27249.1 MAG: Glycerol-3-phosphate dehydrogenase [NAD(P)+] [Alphaproteobacteria bacterium MarineAlpha9_Bin4]|tara:strand:+ start:190 stop:1188 length:999 start_codon:yes stop_codon:yes gene_type:complete
MNNILVLGAGAWGTAIANLIAVNTKKNVYLWSLEEEVAKDINSGLINKKYLPNKKVSKYIIANSTLPKFNTEIIFVVIPSQFIFGFFDKFKSHFEKYKKKPYSFIICSKGIDLKRKEFLSNIIKFIFPKSNIAVLSGPSFAVDVVNKKPTAVTLATKSSKLEKTIVNLLRNNYFRIYLSKDIIGVQINATMKNVLAIAAGLTEGLNLGENARAAILARGIKEIIRLTKAVGGKKETAIGLSGIGDIILTCVSKSSRNYKLGFMLGNGKNLRSIIGKNNYVTEGMENIKVVYYLKRKYKVNMPILEAVYSVLVNEKELDKVIKGLLSRPLSSE